MMYIISIVIRIILLLLTAYFRIVFEFPATGGVIPSSYIQTLKFIRYVNTWDFVVLAMEFLLYGFILFYTAEEIREVVYFRWRYFTFFWNYIDLAILIVKLSILY